MTEPSSPREVEIKLDIDPAGISRLAELPAFSGETDHQRQISVYFDTPKSKLRRNGWVLRVRQVDGRFIQTIKRSGPSPIPVEREEWEEEVGGLEPDLKAIAKTPLAELVKRQRLGQLAPVCRCDVDRTTRMIKNGKCSFELTYDEGSIEGKGTCQPIHEIELELKDGDLAALLASARKLVRQVPARIGVMAKSERGFALNEGKQNVPVKAVPVALAENMSVAQGFATVAEACLKQFRMNEPLLIAGRDAEALHQLRVAVRRLRVPQMGDEPAHHHRRELPQQRERPTVSGGEQRERGGATGATGPQVPDNAAAHHPQIGTGAAERIAQRVGQHQPGCLRPAPAPLIEPQRRRQIVRPPAKRGL